MGRETPLPQTSPPLVPRPPLLFFTNGTLVVAVLMSCVCAMQLLFTHYPRLVISLVAVVNLAVITSAFAIYHLVLAITNQTVYERYKRYYMSRSQHTSTTATNCYSRGVLLNLFEEFFPLQHARFRCVKKTA